MDPDAAYNPILDITDEDLRAAMTHDPNSAAVDAARRQRVAAALGVPEVITADYAATELRMLEQQFAAQNAAAAPAPARSLVQAALANARDLSQRANFQEIYGQATPNITGTVTGRFSSEVPNASAAAATISSTAAAEEFRRRQRELELMQAALPGIAYGRSPRTGQASSGDAIGDGYIRQSMPQVGSADLEGYALADATATRNIQNALNPEFLPLAMTSPEPKPSYELQIDIEYYSEGGTILVIDSAHILTSSPYELFVAPLQQTYAQLRRSGKLYDLGVEFVAACSAYAVGLAAIRIMPYRIEIRPAKLYDLNSSGMALRLAELTCRVWHRLLDRPPVVNAPSCLQVGSIKYDAPIATTPEEDETLRRLQPRE